MTYFNITYIHTYLYIVEYIWQGLSISENICPDASTKFWRFAGFTKYFFKNTMRKLRSRAFQRCITLSSQKWTVWPWEAVFCKKLPQKQLFFLGVGHESGYPNWFNSMFEFCPKLIEFNVQFKNCFMKIQFNKLFNSIQ